MSVRLKPIRGVEIRERRSLGGEPRVRRARAIKPLRPVNVEALRRQMLRNHQHGLRDATLVSVLAYAGLRPEEALALQYSHLRGSTIPIEQKWVDGTIVPGQKTTRPPRFPSLLDVLRADIHDYQLACGRTDGLIFARPDGAPWRDEDWRDWRSRVWQPACEAVGLATITNTTIFKDGKRKSQAGLRRSRSTGIACRRSGARHPHAANQSLTC